MITKQLLDRLFPITGLDPRKYNLVRDRARLLDALNRILPKYSIDNYLRLSAFFGNCGIETDYFKTTIEYASGDAYEGREDLGNTQPGDGRRFKGRGLTQTTGRFNYKAVQKAIGAALGVDLMKTPELLGDVDIAVESACIFWNSHNLNAYADRGEFKQLSGIVNRGSPNKTPLQWPKRFDLYEKCLRLIPNDIGPDAEQVDLPANKDVPQTQQLPDAQPT
jgi:predicted chitinase